MLPSPPVMEPQEELEQLLARKETLKQELKARRKRTCRKLSADRSDNLQKQIRRAQARLSSTERKQRTRRLILLGSYLEHVTGDDAAKRDSLLQGLDVFLERDRDRALFGLSHKENANGNPKLNQLPTRSFKL